MDRCIVFFSKPKSNWKILSPIIRKIQGLPYSHCVIWSGGDIYEATFPVARKISYEDWIKDNVIVGAVSAYFDRDLAERIIAEKTPYSIMQLIWAWLDVKAMLNGIKLLICTEFVALCCLGKVKDQDSIDLKDIASMLKEKYSNDSYLI